MAKIKEEIASTLLGSAWSSCFLIFHQRQQQLVQRHRDVPSQVWT